MHEFDQHPASDITRRHFFDRCQVGLGSIALASLMAKDAGADVAVDRKQPLLLRETHFAAKAKNVIFLHMAGSPPHLDLFDYKPELARRTGEDCPDEF